MVGEDAHAGSGPAGELVVAYASLFVQCWDAYAVQQAEWLLVLTAGACLPVP